MFASIILVFKKPNIKEKKISKKSWVFLTLSGVMTGLAWYLEYSALALPSASAIVVNSIGKLSILFTMAFCLIILKEKFSKKAIFGLIALTMGILVVIFCL